MSTIKPGDVMLTKSCRMVRVLASRDDGAVAMRDYRSRVAVRSVDTDRLSYHSEHELTLVQPPATPQEPTGASPQAETRRDCTCLGTCRGAEGLGPRWKCALETPGPVSPVEPTPEPEVPTDPLAPRKPVPNLMEALKKSLDSLDRARKP